MCLRGKEEVEKWFFFYENEKASHEHVFKRHNTLHYEHHALPMDVMLCYSVNMHYMRRRASECWNSEFSSTSIMIIREGTEKRREKNIKIKSYHFHMMKNIFTVFMSIYVQGMIWILMLSTIMRMTLETDDWLAQCGNVIEAESGNVWIHTYIDAVSLLSEILSGVIDYLIAEMHRK